MSTHKPKKIFFTLDTLANAGTEKSVLDILSHFSNGTNVTVIYFFRGDDLKQAYEKAGIPLRYEPISGRFPLVKGILRLRKILKAEKPDLVVSSILRANLMSRVACWLTGTKLVGTFVSDSYSGLRKSSFSIKRKLGFYFYYRLDRLTAGIPGGWISNSKCIRESNCQYLGIDPGKVEVIYRGRNPEKFRVKDNQLQQGRFRFVYVGRMLETKGVGELLEAFAITAKEFPFASLDMYGKGNYEPAAKEKISRLGISENVRMHGLVPNGWEKLYEADCFVFPSWYEGFSGSVVEAMMVGIPIIASDIPMNLEAVTPDVNALVFKVRDAHDLAEQMKKAIRDYDTMCRMAKQAREEALKRFDIKVIAAQYENYLHRQIAGA